MKHKESVFYIIMQPSSVLGGSGLAMGSFSPFSLLLSSATAAAGESVLVLVSAVLLVSPFDALSP
jgi:hypothetical protein